MVRALVPPPWRVVRFTLRNVSEREKVTLDVGQILRQTFVATVELHRTIGSTNDRAKQCAAERGLELPLLIVAGRQTAGRGRGANRWWTGEAALACSLLLSLKHSAGVSSACSDARQSPPALVPPLVSLAAALAVVETVRPLLPGRVVGIHWPNDVMVDRAKLAGILVEALGGKLVVGIGVNTNNRLADAPPELHGAATTIFELTGRRHEHTALLIALLNHLHCLLHDLSQQPTHVAALADQACLQHGQTLRVQQGDKVIVGRCVGIASDGALLLESPRGPQRVYSGVLVKK